MTVERSHILEASLRESKAERDMARTYVNLHEHNPDDRNTILNALGLHDEGVAA